MTGGSICCTKGEFWKQILMWIFVNCVLSQIPLSIIFFKNSPYEVFFPAFLSYVFTFLVTAHYTLMTAEGKSIKKGINGFTSYFAIFFLMIILILMVLYPNVNPCVTNIIKIYPWKTYILILICSTIISLILCMPDLIKKAKETLQELENEKKAKKSLREFRKSQEIKSEDFIDMVKKDSTDEE